MKMISYWKNSQIIHEDDGLILITGFYDHKNQNNGGVKALGIHWDSYPQSRGKLSPCVVPAATRNAILSGLHQIAVTSGDMKQVQAIANAIKFFAT